MGIVALALSILVACYSQSNQELQNQVQNAQSAINRGNLLDQIGTNLLKDMATASLKDENIKQILAKNGYTVNVNSQQSQPGTTPAP